MKKDGACCATCVSSGCVMKDGSVLAPGLSKEKEDGCGKHICAMIDGEVRLSLIYMNKGVAF